MNRFLSGASLPTLFLLAAAGRAQDFPAEKSLAQGSKHEAVLFDSLPVVEAASLHTQSLLEAPASVTVITDDEIRRRGYRTLAEALADTRGLYISYDRAYQFAGVRGFSIPGDYNTRILMMVNGHSLSENVYGSAGYFGQDFGLDLDLIKRIEIIRGPSSALYGTNGMFATINIVTKSPVEFEPLRVVTEVDNFGERKVEVSSSQYLGHGANLLLSGSVFNNPGQSLYFPQFDSVAPNYGWALNMDGERGYHSFANLIWRNWSVLAYFNNREKLVPTAWYGSNFNGRGTKTLDGRGFVESVYQRDVAQGKLRWRIYYDRYRYIGRYDYTDDSGDPVDQRDGAMGDWAGSQLTYRFRMPRIGFLTVGTEASFDLRTLQTYDQVSPVYQNFLHINRLSRAFAGFFQQELPLSRRWTLYLGGRWDDSRYHAHQLTPRVALIYQPSQSNAIKFLFGRSFRNPNSFELFYDDDGVSQIPNPALHSERMLTFEVAFERRLSKRFELLANAYHYRMADLIAAVPVTDSVQQFQNVTAGGSTGFELEMTGTLARRLKADASIAVQRPGRDANFLMQVNSPARVGKLILETPLFRDRFSLSGGLQYLSERRTFAQDEVPAAYLANITLATRRLPGGMEMRCGLRNLFNRRYWDPVGIGVGIDRVMQDGRNVFLQLSWSPRPENPAGPADSPERH